MLGTQGKVRGSFGKGDSSNCLPGQLGEGGRGCYVGEGRRKMGGGGALFRSFGNSIYQAETFLA